MSEAVDNILKGLVLHFLHRRTVRDAIEQGRSGGVPVELLESLPSIMFEITSAAETVAIEARTFEEVVDEISWRESTTATEQSITRLNVARLMHLALEFMNELGADRGSGSPLPEMSVPWFRYVPKSGQQEDGEGR